MDCRERIRLEEKLGTRELDRVPEWARAEHMERSVAMKELWQYSNLRKIKVESNRVKEYKMDIRTGPQKCLRLPEARRANDACRRLDPWKVTSFVLLACIWILIGYIHSRDDSRAGPDKTPVTEQYEVSNVHFYVNEKELICSFVPNTATEDITFTVNLYSYDNSVPDTTAAAGYAGGVCEAVFDITALPSFAEYSAVLSIDDHGKQHNLTLARTFGFQANGCSWESPWD